ncbi:RNA polymerase sigma factor [Croceitalea rosinachiae]|uniref:RNA polymerase sigma factor n=1 Tax=Croceitalea rosinachiae TaxID=3075596 RepID=A0ABU3AAE0_9FLAO|nr:RNA polymerase sigma factor [Croceitalea sp. F388]MDT0606028.1 RNA polymerase sigma factor [Croceitalea sp. F388]
MVSEKEPNNNLNSFFKEEYHSLKRYVHSKIDHTSESDAEDIIQDVALRIFSRPTDALPISNIGGFVYSAIRNKIIDVMRVKKERIYDEKAVEDLWTDFAELFYDSSENNYPEHLKDSLKTAVMNLKPVYRDIVLAVDFEGYTYREISEETGISPGTLMSRRHRAMSLLLKSLETKDN